MGNKVKGLLISMINEPINLVIIFALILLAFGLNLAALPGFLGNTITSMSVIMTPLVLLFIGMAVRIKFKELGSIFTLLLNGPVSLFYFRPFSSFFFPALGASMILLLVVFPQSACSFWPFAHMSAISSMEEKDEQHKPTFDIDFAVNVLACSLPFSTILIIGIFSFSEVFVNPVLLLVVGGAMVAISFIPFLLGKLKKSRLVDGAHEFSVFTNLHADSSSVDNES